MEDLSAFPDYKPVMPQADAERQHQREVQERLKAMEALHPEVVDREKAEVGKDITNTNGVTDQMANM